VPCKELAGDFYDYVDAGMDRVALLLADVAGKGASAAMMTGVLKSAFRAAQNSAYHPASVIEHLQNGLRPFEETRFVTAFTCRIDRRENVLHYANAGHPPAILRRRDSSIELLEATGTVVGGGLDDIPSQTNSVEFGPGESLFIYTDGLAEAEGSQGMFGHGRIRSLIGSCRHRDGDLLDHIVAELASFTGDDSYEDDVTLLAVSNHLT
jgi:serine phosphatase RsbU (regulator of sigma subunit)